MYSSATQGFFDEVEDLKFALHKSSKLNTEYEATLQRLCQQFGLSYTQTADVTSNKTQQPAFQAVQRYT